MIHEVISYRTKQSAMNRQNNKHECSRSLLIKINEVLIEYFFENRFVSGINDEMRHNSITS